MVEVEARFRTVPYLLSHGLGFIGLSLKTTNNCLGVGRQELKSITGLEAFHRFLCIIFD
jgi:hypothetical protein